MAFFIPKRKGGNSRSQEQGATDSSVHGVTPRPDTQQSYGTYLDVPSSSSSPTSSSESLVSARLLPSNIARNGNMYTQPASPAPSPGPDSRETTPDSQLTCRQRIMRTWFLSKGMLMVMAAQFFGASMNVMTRLLELNGPHGKGMHPFQILFVRMSVTTVCSFLYMWYTKVPQPFGAREVRGLLVLRGISGFIGVFGLYYSLGYLQLSEATVLTFLAPILTCYICSLIIPNETFSRKQQLAGVFSLVGVVLIARPSFLFSRLEGLLPESGFAHTHALSSTYFISAKATVETSRPGTDTDSRQHLIAIGAALVGVVGATSAYTSIRKIGKRAHPLVSVNYFSSLTTIFSTIAVLVLPSVSFRLPANAMETLLLCGLGICGFFLQFLLTAGLSYVPPPSIVGKDAEKGSSHGSRATNMVYTQMLFALCYDKLVWNSMPSPLSWAGSGIILLSAIYVAMSRDENRRNIEVKQEADEQIPTHHVFAGGDDLESGRPRPRITLGPGNDDEQRSLLRGHEGGADEAGQKC